MTSTTIPAKTNSSSQRFADWAVIGISLLALLFGWLVKNSVENRSLPFTASGISAQTPQGWFMTNPQGNEILHITNPLSNGFGTTYTIENTPIPAGATFALVVNLLTLDRGQALTAYRVLGQEPVTVFGRSAFEISYVFIVSDPNLTHNNIPNIVRGQDYIFLNGDHAVIATYWAEEKSFDSDLGRFHKFLGSLKF